MITLQHVHYENRDEVRKNDTVYNSFKTSSSAIFFMRNTKICISKGDETKFKTFWKIDFHINNQPRKYWP